MNRILIVDDDLNSIEPIKIMLEVSGYHVNCMTSHVGILNTIDEFNPNLILLDVFLVDSDGRYICKLLKSFEKTCKIPILLISGAKLDQKDIQSDTLRYGFLQKPFNLDEVIRKIQTLCS